MLFHLLPFCHNLKGEFGDPHFGWLGGFGWELWRWALRRPTTSQHLSIQLSRYLPPLGQNLKVNLCLSPIRPRFGIRVDLGVESGTNRNVDPTLPFVFHTHHRPILHRLATTYNATNRQNDRNRPPIGTGSIDGLKQKVPPFNCRIFGHWWRQDQIRTRVSGRRTCSPLCYCET